MSHYEYKFLQSQTFALFPSLAHIPHPPLFIPLPSSLLYFLPLCISLHFSLAFAQIPNVLYWCSALVLPTHFSWFRRGTAFNFIQNLSCRNITGHKYLFFCPTSLLPQTPSVPHTFLFLPDPLTISLPLYFLCFLLFFGTHILHLSLAIYLSHPSELSCHWRKGQKKHL